jgi:hypothetical protein
MLYLDFQSVCPSVPIGSPPPLPLEPKREGQHSLAGEGAEGANSDDWIESLVRCLPVVYSTVRGGGRGVNSEKRYPGTLYTLCTTDISVSTGYISWQENIQYWTQPKLHDNGFVDIYVLFCCPLRQSLYSRYIHGLINNIDTKAKCRHLKYLTCKETLRQVFIIVYRLEIKSVMMVFSNQLCELLPL